MNTMVDSSNIPWAQIKGTELEELLYWLLEDLGAKELRWRTGGISGSSSDGGRDIEAIFYVTTPDGEMEQQRWWVQAKGRAKTVEPNAVKETLTNALGRSDIHTVVIATNTVFSNATTDWVRDWQRERRTPQARLWPRVDLERILMKHPSVVARFFPYALSPRGKVQAYSTRFWNQHFLAGKKDLAALWDERKQFQLTAEECLSLIVSESANGDLNLHHWPEMLSNDRFAALLAMAIVNVLFLAKRAGNYGIGQDPLLGALSYLVELALLRLEPETTLALFENPWELTDLADIPEGFRRYVQSVVLSRLRQQLADECSKDCPRLDVTVIDRDVGRSFWSRFGPESGAQSADNATKAYLVIQKQNELCKVGFDLGKDSGCPLFETSPEEGLSAEQTKEFLLACRAIIVYRTGRLRA